MEPAEPPFQVLTRDPGSRARAGLLRTAHGDVRTPAFVPLATKATVKGLVPDEVRGLGYDIVLGQHLPPLARPGRRADRRASAGCTSSWAGGRRSSPTPAASRCSRWATAPSPTRSRAARRTAPSATARCWRSRRRACASAPTSTARSASWRPRRSMEVQAALDSDLALVFDECTPFHVDRDYTARSTERTHRWLARCLDWHAEHGPSGQLVYGIVQGGVHEDLRVESAQTIAAAACDGIAIGGSLGAEKEQMYEVVEWTTAALPGGTPAPPARHRRDRRPDPRSRAGHRHVRLRDAHAPRPPRHGAGARPGQPLARRSDRGAVPRRATSRSWRAARARRAPRGTPRGYLRYLPTSRELTGAAAAHAAQPRVRRARDGAAARGDRRRARSPTKPPRCAPARRV